jgi:peptide/nickel transport system substrate-binding protein
MYPKLKILIVILMAASVLLSACVSQTATPAPATAPTTAPATAVATTPPTVQATMPPTAKPVSEPTKTASVVAPQKVRGDVLTIALAIAPPTLDPGVGEPSFEGYITPAYDALLRINPKDGQIMPSLALTWKWVGTDFKTFEMTLRPNVRFSDGSEFNAEAVKTWLEFQKKNASVTASNIGLDTAEVTGPLSITLHLAQPNVMLVRFLTRGWISGAIACPAAVAKPDLVATGTCGAGPYMLDAKNTVTADTYTYIPNPYYWNPDAIYWNKMVIKVVANNQSALDALRTGQIQLMVADASVINAGVADGMKLAGVEQNVQGLLFLLKGGKAVPAIGDVRVRQALNYAIDRAALAKVLSGGIGRPVSSEFLPGGDAYDATFDNYYPYDVTKAKALLAAAGYAAGFEVTILSIPQAGLDILAQAVASYWEAIGVKTIVDNKASAPEFIDASLSGKYAVSVAGLGTVTPVLTLWKCCIMPGSFWNRDTTAPPELQALIDKISVTDIEVSAPIARQVNKYLTENAWYVPVNSAKQYLLYGPGVAGGEPTPAEPTLSMLDIAPLVK